MKRLLLVILVLGLGVGCTQGSPVTDVGNPTIAQKPPEVTPNPESPSAVAIPKLQDLPGNYRVANATATGTCPVPSGAIPQVVLGNQANQLVLMNFLSYSPDTQAAATIYTAGAFSISDASVSVTCTGQAQFVNNAAQLTLRCQVGSDTSTQCTSVFLKEGA